MPELAARVLAAVTPSMRLIPRVAGPGEERPPDPGSPPRAGTLARMVDLRLDEMRAAAGLGVAGNFAGHLEQAGEASDFADVVSPADAPKGVFPWYVPGSDSFLGTFPLSSSRLHQPPPDAPGELQIEPEAGVLCAVEYDAEGRVAGLSPRALGAFNDCSIRRPGAAKISHKKNWGPGSKGLAVRCFELSDLEGDGALATLRLAAFLRRDGQVHAYGLDSPLAGYSYAGRRLLDWMIGCLREQAGGAGSPLEPVGDYLAAAGCPDRALVGIGATRYTPYGETTFLRPGDESIVVVYDGDATGPGQVVSMVAAGREDDLPAASVLRQLVVPPANGRSGG